MPAAHCVSATLTLPPQRGGPEALSAPRPCQPRSPVPQGGGGNCQTAAPGGGGDTGRAATGLAETGRSAPTSPCGGGPAGRGGAAPALERLWARRAVGPRGIKGDPAPPTLPASSSAAPQPISCRLLSPPAVLRLVRRGAIRRAGPRYVPSDNPPGPTIARRSQSVSPKQPPPPRVSPRPGLPFPPHPGGSRGLGGAQPAAPGERTGWRRRGGGGVWNGERRPERRRQRGGNLLGKSGVKLGSPGPRSSGGAPCLASPGAAGSAEGGRRGKGRRDGEARQTPAGAAPLPGRARRIPASASPPRGGAPQPLPPGPAAGVPAGSPGAPGGAGLG